MDPDSRSIRPYTATVTVWCKSEEQAETVLRDRLGSYEDYGFLYSLDYRLDPTTNEDNAS